MRADIKARWVEALRSGKYNQAVEVLRNDSGFCCLGVLCDVVKKDLSEALGHDVDWGNPLNLNECRRSYYFLDQVGELPAEVRDLCDFRGGETLHGSPIVDGKSLIVMNDTDGNTFDEIADAIEKYL